MSYLHRDCVLGQDNELHKAALGHVEGWASIDGGPRFPVRAAVSLRLAITNEGNPWLLYSDHTSGQSCLRHPTGLEKLIGGNVGAYGQAIRAFGSEVRVYVRGGNLNDLTDITAYGKEGDVRGIYNNVLYDPLIHHIEADGLPVTTVMMKRPRTVAGIDLYDWDEKDNWIVGHADGDVDGQLRGVVVIVSPTREVRMWPYPTAQSPQSPRIAVHPDGRVWVALSNEGTPEPDEFMSLTLPFKAWVARPTPKPKNPSFPSPPPSMPEMWIGCCTDISRNQPAGLGNFEWGIQSTTRPVMEGVDWKSTVEGRNLLCPVWLSDNGNDPKTVKKDIVFAMLKNAKAIYLHEDDRAQRENVREAAGLVSAEGLLAIHGTNVNQGELADPMTETWGITLNVRTHGKDLTRLRDGIVAAIEDSRQRHGFALLAIFGWHDGGPLEERYPEAADYLKAVIALVKTPELFPGQIKEIKTELPKAEEIKSWWGKRKLVLPDKNKIQKLKWWEFWK